MTYGRGALFVTERRSRIVEMQNIRKNTWRIPLIASMLGFLIALRLTPAATSATTAGARIPSAISHYQMADLHGDDHSLAEYRGRPVVLNVWATWCPPCQQETPRLERAYEAYRARGLVVLGVDQDDPRAKVRAFVSRFRLRYSVVLDPKELFGAAAGFSFPTTVFVDRSGHVRSVHHGEIGSADLQREIETLLAK